MAVKTILAVLMAVCASANATLDISRTVTKVGAGAAAKITLDKGCSQTDPYGSNDCSLQWDTNYTVSYNATFPPITAGHQMAIAMTIDGALPFNVKCPACGGECQFTIPVIKKSVDIKMPDCPITSKIGSDTFLLPSDSLPVKVTVSGTVQLLDSTGAVVDSVSVTVAADK
eukprot:CAMPEP_0182927042 /NCGR_PEP_ID=MMETSP0105_2-20130417/13013_1 /TAXON_ID=81532 ORGANISM="Acanthoeca-like sp., Strain 10tr" /NCGR_SAMPLE_ID=MMETSP0105_2 /ASSEMBLY_ACC=CAM_ASM_000205 /LENGTH=170 /DNA_ID=CAMNT_0025064969 /DNA_START=49 /DNA_END=561 /DNA_ORIENTATION=-